MLSVNHQSENGTRIIINARFSYVSIREPKSYGGGKPKYSVCLIVPKSDTAAVEKIKAAISSAYNEGADRLRGNEESVPSLEAVKSPLRDGERAHPDDPAYAGTYIINASSFHEPEVVDKDCVTVTDKSEVYSGVYGRASVSFYAYNVKGNAGIACRLYNIQKLSDGSRLDGKTTAAADFSDFLG